MELGFILGFTKEDRKRLRPKVKQSLGLLPEDMTPEARATREQTTFIQRETGVRFKLTI
jgi:hypothetical protein